jgi:predicted naringenin-chalcone synthase
LRSSAVSETAILGLGSALAAYSSRQMDLLSALSPAPEVGSARERLARRLFRNARIEERRFCIPDFRAGAAPTLYRASRTGARRRMEVYRREAPPLAASACERALKSARVAADEITHLVVVTCTGIFVPGPDVELVGRLGLRTDVERTLVTFMGCSGAFHGLRVARRAALEPDARVLLVCVELCSLHQREEAAVGSLVAQSIFADGAAAVVLGAPDGSCAPILELGQARTHLQPGTRGALTWELHDDGFAIHLAPELPAIVGRNVAGFVAPLLEGVEPANTLAWLVHPGGAAILRAVERALGLEHDDLASAWSVLRRLGNTSSAAILYVLEEALLDLPPGREGVMLGFGPGLTFEALRFRRGAGRI